MNEFIEIPANKRSISKRKLVHNIGINDASYVISNYIGNRRYKCPYYVVWLSMIGRCYNPSFHVLQPTYIDCTVCEEWLTFSNFKSWMEMQDWQGKQLDKDLLIRGNKIYSPKTCMFVSQEINSLINDKTINGKNLLIGACWCNKYNKYLACCNIYGKNKHLGYFDTKELASAAYKEFKRNHILSVANTLKDDMVKQALIHIANTEYL